MTTFITKESHPRLPEPSAYARYLDRLAAERAARERDEQKGRKIARAVVLTWLLVGLVLAVAAYLEGGK